MDCTNKLKLVFGDLTLGVRGEGWHVIFNYMRGGIESLVTGGREWMYRAPQPAFWRALTDNDRGSQFHLKSGCWLTADMFIRLLSVAVAVNGKTIATPVAPENNRYTPDETADSVAIAFTFETLTVPAAKVPQNLPIRQLTFTANEQRARDCRRASRVFCTVPAYPLEK